MAHSDQQFSLDTGSGFRPVSKRQEIRDIIKDRKSKYTVVAFPVKTAEEVKHFFQELKKDSYFAKATHNTYAYRISQENGSILEGKNDDGEQGAGMCILRELQREEAVDMMLVVTRYFGGIQLHGDRFRNVTDTCKLFFENLRQK